MEKYIDLLEGKCFNLSEVLLKKRMIKGDKCFDFLKGKEVNMVFDSYPVMKKGKGFFPIKFKTTTTGTLSNIIKQMGVEIDYYLTCIDDGDDKYDTLHTIWDLYVEILTYDPNSNTITWALGS